MKKIILVITFFAISTSVISAQIRVRSMSASDPAVQALLEQMAASPGTVEQMQGITEFIVAPNPVRVGSKFSVQVGPLWREDTIIAHILASEGLVVAADSTRVASTNPKLSFIAPAAGEYIATVYLGTNTKSSKQIPFTVTEKKAKKRSRRGKE